MESILVINCGSSSVKFAVFPLETHQSEPSLTGLAERLGSDDATLSWKDETRTKTEKALGTAGVPDALKEILSLLPHPEDVVAVGHRVVHGGEAFSSSALIDEDVLRTLDECSALAPLHNPANIAGITAAQSLFPEIPHVAVFDTAFHQTLPEQAYLYPVPYAWYEEHKVRRYGFHGTSHQYVGQEAAAFLGKPFSEFSGITIHLGNGCSACAIREGRSADTSMGLSPLEGLMMGTRSGSIDPAIHEFIANATGCELADVMSALNRESGLLGVSGLSNDMRTVEAAAADGHPRAALALKIFCHQLAKVTMSLAASLTRLDAIVFTGGIGENSATVRSMACEQLALLGLSLDSAANAETVRGESGRIDDGTGTTCLVIPTNEEKMIADSAATFS